MSETLTTIRDPWQPGVRVRWARSLDQRPLAVVDLDHVTIAGRFAPLSITLKEVAGIFPLGWFDLDEPTRPTPGEDKPLGIEEVVERVAVAISAQAGRDWDDLRLRDNWMGYARSAIEAYEQARASTGE
jgi:hypothetical protein